MKLLQTLRNTGGGTQFKKLAVKTYKLRPTTGAGLTGAKHVNRTGFSTKVFLQIWHLQGFGTVWDDDFWLNMVKSENTTFTIA